MTLPSPWRTILLERLVSLLRVPNWFLSQSCIRLTHPEGRFFPSVESKSMFDPLPEKPDPTRSSSRCSIGGSASGPSRQLRERNRGGPEVLVHRRPGHREQAARACTRRGGGRSRTSSSATRRCRASTSATRTASTARGCGSRSGSRDSWASTRSARSRRTASRSSRARCREVVVKSSEQLTRGSIRLGQWMDWGNDYFTFSDTNIEYIWGFLKTVNERGWLYMGHRATAWCPRCGTSLSQHELTQGGRLPGEERPVALRPLPAARPPGRVARDLDDDAVDAAGERRRRRATRRASTACARTASGCSRRGSPRTRSSRRVQGAELVGLRYQGPFDNLPPGAGIEHRVVPWDEVSLDGAGHRDRPHRDRAAGPEDFELGASLGLPVLTPGRRGRATSTTTTAGCTASRPSRPATRSSATSPSAASSSRPGRTPRLRRTAGAATRRSSTASPTTGSSASTRSARSCSRRTRRSSGCPSTWASAWTTGCATWATGTSRAAATTACRCRSIRARAGT